MKLKLLSKAKTLKSLENRLEKSKVLPLFSFYVKDYLLHKDNFLSTILDKFDSKLIIRSSAYAEDKLTDSNAGEFETVLNVKPEKKDLDSAILKVLDSYKEPHSKDEIFIQPMLTNVSTCGVIFTSDIDTLSNYYIINYDNTTGSTTSVTDGSSNSLKTFISLKNSDKKYIKDKTLQKLIEASKELENLFDNQFLDIEFGVSKSDIYIFQVRAIVTKSKENLSKIDFKSHVDRLYKKLKTMNKVYPSILGERAIFGVMPDWNPAEIIGVKPKQLALSLYKELITDEIWAYQRDNYGYRNLRSNPLLHNFLGVPFIDVRVSFNSFIPKGLDENIAKKLMNYYLKELSQKPHYHDKVEFEIIFSCYYLNISKKLKVLKKFGFNKNEIKRLEFSLLEVTNSIIDTNNGLYKKDLAKIDILKSKFEKLKKTKLTSIEKIYWFIEDCKRYGTLPFAGVARAGFIAIQFLKSFVSEKIITTKEYSSFLNSLDTVSKKLQKDYLKLSNDDFFKKYGHLRPGTYDILSKNYLDGADEYFCDRDSLDLEDDEEFKFKKSQLKRIDKLLIENGIKSDAKNLIKFIKEAIEGREYAKFIFTKSLNQILKEIERIGENLNIDIEDLAYLDISIIKNLYGEVNDLKSDILNSILQNRKKYEVTKGIKLPSIIIKPSDVYSFFLEDNEPNFVTLGSISADVVGEKSISNKSLKDKIILIISADPGYDYLFSKSIGALITCYGGANSHMAIRCAELNIPAVIGVGEKRFNDYLKAERLNIDCLNRKIVTLK